MSDTTNDSGTLFDVRRCDACEQLRPPIEWTPNADAGDHSGHCSACGQVRDDPHTLSDCLVMVSSERDAALDELADSQAREARLREALRMDQPYPLTRILELLSDAADHLLRDHDCDRHGYELVGAARDHAREVLAALAAGGEDLDHRNMSDEEARAILDEEGIDPDAAYDRLMAKVREQEGGTDGK